MLDDGIDRAPDRPALRMRLQRDVVHARLFGRPPAELRIGRYLIHGTLGQGGMGKVLRAHDETLGRDVALKVLHEGRGGRHEQRLLREAQALARLADPNVVRVYDVGEIDDRLCMAMELVHGEPLHRWQREPRPWPEALDVYRQAGRGLAAAHAVGLIHRDFKPANCILDEDGVVKVLDFGLARGVQAEPEPPPIDADLTHDEEPSIVTAEDSMTASRSQRMLEQVLTRTGTMLGTLAYMAPEQLMGKPAEPSSDQFAFCVALYEALYGRRPFGGSTAIAILYAIQSQRPAAAPLRAGLPPVPRWLQDILRRGLSVASHDRYPSMSALLDALERRLTRRRRVRSGAMGAVALVALGGVLSFGGVFAGEQPCDGLREASLPGWSAADRDAVGAALGAADIEGIDHARAQVESGLDAYAEAWIEARADACEATWVRREAGEQALARRMACLDDRATHVRAATERLAELDDRTAAHAASTVGSLPSLQPCEDVEALLRGPAPVPTTLADEAAQIRDLIARSWASGATGHEDHGEEAASRAVAAAEALPDAPVLLLEALQNRGHLFRRARRLAEAREDLSRGLELSERLDDESRTIDLLRELIIAAHEGDDPAALDAWQTVSRGKLSRLDDQPRRRAQRWSLEAIAAFYTRPRRLDDALEWGNKAAQAYDALQPPAIDEQLTALLLLGNVQRRRREFDDARATFERAGTLAERSGRQPYRARVQYKLGHLHYVQGQFDEALVHLDASLANLSKFFGARSVAVIRTHHILSQIHRLQGSVATALEHATAAHDSIDDRVPLKMKGEIANTLASLHRSAGQWDLAIDHYGKARAAWSSMPSPDRALLAMLDSNVADCLVVKGDVDAAGRLYDEALVMLDMVVAPDDRRRAYPLLGRGELMLANDEPAAAIEDLRRVLEHRSAVERDPSLAARARWALARALRSGGESGREASNLAHQARAAFAGANVVETVAQIDAWLEHCGAACSPPTEPDGQPQDAHP